MRIRLKTSFLSMICVLAAGASHATPSVRTVGGDGTYDSAALAAAAAVNADESRSGSLRGVGLVRPTMTVSQTKAATGTSTGSDSGTMLKKATLSTSKNLTTAKGTVSTPRATSVGRLATVPRLSLGKYVGATTGSVSQSVPSSSPITNDLVNQIDQLQTNVDSLTNTIDSKQNTLHSGEFVYIDDTTNELSLDVAHLQEVINVTAGTNGREIELRGNDGDRQLEWRYVGVDSEGHEYTWNRLISYDDIKGEPGETPDMTSYISQIENRLTNLTTNLTEYVDNAVNNIQGNLDSKLDSNLGAENSGKILVVGPLGDVGVDDAPYSKSETYNKDETYNKTEIDTKLESIPQLNLATVATSGSYNDLENKPELGALSSKEKIKNADVADDAAIERSKLAQDVIESLNRSDDWLTGYPTSGRHVLGVIDGGKEWLQVIGPDDVIY